VLKCDAAKVHSQKNPRSTNVTPLQITHSAFLILKWGAVKRALNPVPYLDNIEANGQIHSYCSSEITQLRNHT